MSSSDEEVQPPPMANAPTHAMPSRNVFMVFTAGRIFDNQFHVNVPGTPPAAASYGLYRAPTPSATSHTSISVPVHTAVRDAERLGVLGALGMGATTPHWSGTKS